MYSVLTTYIEISCFINLCLPIGDGRMDSPGFNANFYPYVLINNNDLDILDMAVVHEREMGLKSTNMEKESLICGLGKIHKEGVNVVEIATDAHSKITKMISIRLCCKYYISGPNISAGDWVKSSMKFKFVWYKWL